MRTPWTPWDRRVAARAVALATLSLAIAWLLTAATDEGGVPWTTRAVRVLPIAPACTAIGTALALARSRARGEELALETLGASPLRRAASAILGGAVPVVLAALAVALVPAVDARAFFPTRQAQAELHYQAGAFVDPSHGIAVDPDGAITRSAVPDGADASSTSASAPPLRARSSAATAILTAGLALALLAARVRRASLARAAIGTGATVIASIVLFHAAAARVVPAPLAAAPSLALFVVAASGYVVRAGREGRTARGEKPAG